MKRNLIVVLVALIVLSFVAVCFGAALTQDRDTYRRDGALVSLSVAASNTIFAGSIVAVDTNGYAVAASADNSLTVIGRANHKVDNSSGDAGDLAIEVGISSYLFANAASITDDDIGKLVYVVDDQTVSLDSVGNSRPVAGRILDTETAGVWVDFTRSFSGPSSAYNIVFANVTVAESDADGIVTETRAGILATDIITASVYNSANGVAITNAIVAADVASFFLNAAGGAGTRINYSIIRATQ